MSEVIFIYKKYSIIIQVEPNEMLTKVIDKFCLKANVDKKKVSFLYNDEILNENITLDKIKLKNDKQIIIIVKEGTIRRSNEIICPECYKNLFIEVDKYKIKLKCMNKHNKTLLFKEFEDSQLIDLSKIICNDCKIKNMGNVHENIFYKCLNCKIDLCPLCFSKHNKEHKRIKYNEINNLCNKHYDIYENYCVDCNKNICLKCFEEHNNHKIKYFGKLYISEDKIKEEEKDLRNLIDNLKEDIEKIKLKLDKVKTNLEKYYKIYKSINKNNCRNYETLLNKNEINNNDKIKNDIKEIINDDNINNKFKKIINVYYQMEYIEEIIIRYKINKNENEIKIFGDTFINNNKNKCTIMYEDKEYDLKEKWNVDKIKNEILEIKLKK
jgi:hypothetical protein